MSDYNEQHEAAYVHRIGDDEYLPIECPYCNTTHDFRDLRDNDLLVGDGSMCDPDSGGCGLLFPID